MHISSERRLHLWTLLCYGLFTVILLHPLWVYNGTRVAGYDYFSQNWTLWWIRHALTTPGLDVYLNNFVMYPAVSNYGYHVMSAIWYPVWALLEPSVGTLTAVNVTITLACWLNGYAMFAWLRSERVAPGLALLGGVVLQALPISRYLYYNTHLNLMTWFWLPVTLLLWKQVSLQTTWRRALAWGVAFGVLLWGLLMTDLQFPIFAAFLVVPYGILTLIRADGAGRARLIVSGVVAVVVGVALMWFVGPLPYIVRFDGDFLPSPVEERPGVPFPRGFLTMDDQWWEWDHPSLGAFFPVALLITTLVAAWKGIRRATPAGSTAPQTDVTRRAWYRWFWLALSLPPLVLAIGPYVAVGDTRIPMPFIWLYDLTNGNFRMPWRLAPVGVVAGLTFIGLVWTPIFARWQHSRQALSRSKIRTTRGSSLRVLAITVTALLALFVSFRLFETAPLQPLLPQYEFYETMGREPYDYVVMDVPTGMGSGETLIGSQRVIQYEWYGMIHGKRMTNGFVSRAPIEDFYYISVDDPMMAWLGQRRFLEPEAVEAQLRDRIEQYPVGYVVVHSDDVAAASSVAVNEIIGYFNQHDDLLCPVWIEGAAVVYRTRWHPDGCPPRIPPEVTPGVYEIDVGAAEDARYLGWGWYPAEDVGGTHWRWSGALPQLVGEAPVEQAVVYADLPPGAYTLSLAAQAFWQPQALTVLVNGQRVGVEQVETDGLQTLSFEVPAQAIGEGQHVEITLVYDDAIVPNEVGQSADTRRLAVAVDWLRFERHDNE